MKLAHLILAHESPRQLERLAKRLYHPDAHIYIHLDHRTDISPFRHIGELPNTWFTHKRVDVKWGEYSIITATLTGMEEILASGNQYSHINLLSGRDYPLRGNEEIQAFLFANADKSYMWYDRIFDDWVHGQARINDYYLGDYGFPGRYQAAALLTRILPARKMPGNLTPYGRAQWMTITPEAAVYTLRFIKDNPRLQRFFRVTWAVDEVFFQTILCNSHLLHTIVNNNLRYITLTKEFKPHIYTIADAEALTSSGKFYARKFDINTDAAIFNYLDTHI